MRALLVCLLSVAATAAELRLDSDLVHAGPLAQGDCTILLAGGGLRVPVRLGGILSVRGDAPGRRLDGSIATGAPVPCPPQASFVARSLRAVVEDDWRESQRIAGRREDRVIDLATSAWGTPGQRSAWGIGGSDADWDRVSVQYDGWIAVTTDRVDLASRSDDGSRLWLDRDGDGRVGPGEWAGNGWGTAHAGVTEVLHRNVPRGVYRFRLQGEDGGGGNCLSLLWNAEPSADLQPVPAAAFVRLSGVQLQGVHPLVLAAAVGGPGGVIIDGPVVTWEAGASCAGPLRVQRGSLRLTADLAVDEVVVAAGATLDVGPHRLRAGRIAAEGGLVLAGGGIDIVAAGASRLASLAGTGSLRIDGGAQVRLGEAGAVAVEVVRGAAIRPEHAVTAGAVAPAPGLGADLPVALPGSGPFVLDVEVEVPADAPADLGLLAYARDRHDSWHQRAWPGPLPPGRHRLAFAFGPDDAVVAGPGEPRWNADSAARCERAGLRLWSVAGGGAAVRIRTEAAMAPGRRPPPRLIGLQAPATARCGSRWELACLPQPFPDDPFDPEAFALDAEFSGPDGAVERIAGFYAVPGAALDGGDRVRVRADGAPAFQLRWRPRQPGAWRCRLTARWHSGANAVCELPVRVDGPAWDGYLRVDQGDPRFFAAGGAFAWPVGANLHAVSDARAQEVLGTRPTPQRGIFAYDAFLGRFAAAGADLAEVWMAAWNLGIEWNAQRPGFAGAGRYGQGNAAQLDALLDGAWARGMRIVLAVNHLGQGSDWCAPEWALHPYNRANGGWLAKAGELFTDARALAHQERYRRYVIARWGDHPAVACWKLWTEIDLTNMRGNAVAWHERASARWRALDVYRHPVTTHWSGTYRVANPAVIALPGIDLATIDAYHGDGGLLVELLRQSTLDPAAGLAGLGKPVLCTEYGVNWNGGPREQLLAETATAPFAGLVSGHAGAPMCWWFERLDQDGWWDGFRAIRAFAAGEDLRGAEAHGERLGVQGDGAAAVWAQAWIRPGRLLGYAVDREWGSRGGEGALHDGLGFVLPGDARAGALQLEWWDADRGTVLERRSLDHPGGPLSLAAPPWRRHLAFKLWR